MLSDFLGREQAYCAEPPRDSRRLRRQSRYRQNSKHGSVRKGVDESHDHPPCKAVSLASCYSSNFSLLNTLNILNSSELPQKPQPRTQWDTFAKHYAGSTRPQNERDFGVLLSKGSPK